MLFCDKLLKRHVFFKIDWKSVLALLFHVEVTVCCIECNISNGDEVKILIYWRFAFQYKEICTSHSTCNIFTTCYLEVKMAASADTQLYTALVRLIDL